ncbi:MAG: GSCFA domain-containing protein [Chitinophagaceae bacterium]|nr:GSCFA domain-containing protein [Chitinophagaceae bacterium]
MNFMADVNIPSPKQLIAYPEKIFLSGSCFTEHIGRKLEELKFPVLQNPNGILFDPLSVCKSIVSYIRNHQYAPEDLFYSNELWQSWDHHSQFSGMEKDAVLATINNSQQKAHGFLKQADWLIITLGSSFSYQLSEDGRSVANCHREPARLFNKHLLGIEEIIRALDNCIHQLFHFNEKIKIIFTISPVRHLRDGVIENNRSKARLIEAVHHMVNKFDRLYYFPAYELVIDVLRDYRFYDVDLAHPNYAATEFVFDTFEKHFIGDDAQALIQEIRKINIARKHKPFHPETQAHKNFLIAHLKKVIELQEKYENLDFRDEVKYFMGHT